MGWKLCYDVLLFFPKTGYEWGLIERSLEKNLLPSFEFLNPDPFKLTQIPATMLQIQAMFSFGMPPWKLMEQQTKPTLFWKYS